MKKIKKDKGYKLKHIAGFLVGICAGLLTFWLTFKLRDNYYVDTLIVDSITTICMTMSIQICASAVYEVANLIYNNKTVFLTKGSPTTTLLTLAIFNKYRKKAFKIQDERSSMLMDQSSAYRSEHADLEAGGFQPEAPKTVSRGTVGFAAILALGIFMIIEICSIGLSASMPRILGTKPFNSEIIETYPPETTSLDEILRRAKDKNFLRYEFSYNETEYDTNSPTPVMTTKRTTDQSYLFGGIFGSGFADGGPNGKQLSTIEKYIGNVLKQKLSTSGVYTTEHDNDAIPYIKTSTKTMYYGNDVLEKLSNQTITSYVNMKLNYAINMTTYEVRSEDDDTYSVQVHNAQTVVTPLFGHSTDKDPFHIESTEIESLDQILYEKSYDFMSTSKLVDTDNSFELTNITLKGSFNDMKEQIRQGCKMARDYGQAASLLYYNRERKNILINYYITYEMRDDGSRIDWCQGEIVRRNTELYIIDTSSWPKRTSFGLRNEILAAAPGNYHDALQALKENLLFRMKYSNYIVVSQKIMYNIWPKCTVILSFMAAWAAIKIYSLVVTRCYDYADLVDVTRELALDKCTDNTFNVGKYRTMYVGTYYNYDKDCNHIGIKYADEEYKPAQPEKDWQGRR